ncbi:hypothetical protein [Bhargavaea massiliensis]|uniref:hypothetical protein n=1 Tax=Bhargavaea massiliensis TaxID=2697500 RepID=UPI001BCF6E21|nr:hypothetical protein [Bhargavaea massiliensis]
MKMSEIDELKDFELFVKFTQEKHVDSLLNGNFYMKNINYFIELENKNKIKGVGDKWEAAHVFESNEMYLYDSKEKKIIKHLGRGEIITRYEQAKKVPIFCFSRFTANDYSLFEDTDTYLSFKLNIGEDLKKFKEFGDTAVIFPRDIEEIFRHATDSAGLHSVFKEIQYDSFSGKSLSKLEALNQRSVKMFFWKSKLFRYQREVRLALYNTFVDDNFVLKTDIIKNASIVSKIGDFLERSVIIVYKKNSSAD